LITDTVGLLLGVIGTGSRLLRERRVPPAGTAPRESRMGLRFLEEEDAGKEGS